MKKLVTLVLALAAVLCLFVVSAGAVDKPEECMESEAAIKVTCEGDTNVYYFAELQDKVVDWATENLTTGMRTITFLKDIDSTNTTPATNGYFIFLGGNTTSWGTKNYGMLTFDLNGHSWTYVGERTMINCLRWGCYIKNGTINYTHTKEGSTDHQIFDTGSATGAVMASSPFNPKFYVENCTINDYTVILDIHASFRTFNYEAEYVFADSRINITRGSVVMLYRGTQKNATAASGEPLIYEGDFNSSATFKNCIIDTGTGALAATTRDTPSTAKVNIEDCVIRGKLTANVCNATIEQHDSVDTTIFLIITQPVGGTISLNKTKAEVGETVTATVTPATDYAFSHLLVNGEKVEGLTFNVPDAEKVTVSAVLNKLAYTVKFVNHDGTVLQSGEVAYGDIPAYTGETPAKAATKEFTYTFIGWDKEIAAVAGDVTYTAQFEAVRHPKFPLTAQADGNTLQFLAPKDRVTVGASAVITRTYADGRQAATVTIPMSQWTEQGDNYCIPYTVDAKGLGDTLTAEIFNAENQSISTVWTGTVGSILAEQIASADETAKNKTLSLLGYSAAAQAFFGYNADAENSFAADIAALVQANAESIAAARKDESKVTGNVVLGSSMVLDNDMTMKFYFNAGDITVQVGGEAAELKAAGDYYCCEIPVTGIFDAITVTATRNGETVATATDSPASYFARLYATGTESAKNLADAVILMGLLEK